MSDVISDAIAELSELCDELGVRTETLESKNLIQTLKEDIQEIECGLELRAEKKANASA